MQLSNEDSETPKRVIKLPPYGKPVYGNTVAQTFAKAKRKQFIQWQFTKKFNRWWYVHLHMQNHQCVYCGVSINKANCEVDHIQPLSKGGNNNPDNLVLCCRSCNTRKADKEVDKDLVAKNLFKLRKHAEKKYDWLKKIK